MAAGGFLLGFVLLWCCFYLFYKGFPYVRPGADQVTEFKLRLVREGHPFSSGHKRLRMMAFGDSKTLAGFVPDVFERTMALEGIAVESYNLGLPGDVKYVSRLETLIARGEAPDVALLSFAWPDTDEAKPDAFHFIADDDVVMTRIFPFRRLPRDLFVFAGLARARGGALAFYREAESILRQVETDRGYYFISGQSHYPGDRLPDDYKDADDTPALAEVRHAATNTETFRRLSRELADHHIRCVFTPRYFREGQRAPVPDSNTALAATLKGSATFTQAGPDYYLYPNRYFSDTAHLNREGAAIYTRQLGELMAGWLRENGKQSDGHAF